MIQTGAHWVEKGSKDEQDNGNGGTDKASLTANSIEIPVNFLYTSNGGFFIGAGPSASFAVSGKAKFNDLSADLHFGNSTDDDMKGFDFRGKCCYRLSVSRRFPVAANFNQGFSNLVPGDAGSSSIKKSLFRDQVRLYFKRKEILEELSKAASPFFRKQRTPQRVLASSANTLLRGIQGCVLSLKVRPLVSLNISELHCY